MFTSKIKLKTFLWCFLPVLLYLITGCILAKYFGISLILGSSIRTFKNMQEFSSLFLENSWIALVVPDIPEEVVFRAWILNGILGQEPSKKQKIISIIISNILFFIIHLPTYIFYEKITIIPIIFSRTKVFIIGSIFSIMFLKSKNIIFPYLFTLFGIILCLYFIHNWVDAFIIAVAKVQDKIDRKIQEGIKVIIKNIK